MQSPPKISLATTIERPRVLGSDERINDRNTYVFRHPSENGFARAWPVTTDFSFSPPTSIVGVVRREQRGRRRPRDDLPPCPGARVHLRRSPNEERRRPSGRVTLDPELSTTMMMTMMTIIIIIITTCVPFLRRGSNEED